MKGTCRKDGTGLVVGGRTGAWVVCGVGSVGKDI